MINKICVTIDQYYNIKNYTQEFADLLLYDEQDKKTLLNFRIDQLLECDFNLGSYSTALLIKNCLFNQKPMLGYFYIKYNNLGNYLAQLQIINWLNWIEQIHISLNYGYNSMLKINDRQLEVIKSSDIHAFNALLPILMHNPIESIKRIPAGIFHGILRKFINRRDTDYMSKDYAKQTFSRLETSIKEQTGIGRMEIHELLKKRDLLSFKVNGNIYIPNTVVKNNLLIPGYNDKLLNSFLQGFSPRDT